MHGVLPVQGGAGTPIILKAVAAVDASQHVNSTDCHGFQEKGKTSFENKHLGFRMADVQMCSVLLNLLLQGNPDGI